MTPTQTLNTLHPPFPPKKARIWFSIISFPLTHLSRPSWYAYFSNLSFRSCNASCWFAFTVSIVSVGSSFAFVDMSRPRSPIFRPSSPPTAVLFPLTYSINVLTLKPNILIYRLRRHSHSPRRRRRRRHLRYIIGNSHINIFLRQYGPCSLSSGCFQDVPFFFPCFFPFGFAQCTCRRYHTKFPACLPVNGEEIRTRYHDIDLAVPHSITY